MYTIKSIHIHIKTDKTYNNRITIVRSDRSIRSYKYCVTNVSRLVNHPMLRLATIFQDDSGVSLIYRRIE